MDISVIIPTRNRARELSIALDSIVKQILPQEKFEVLIVDNGSTDSTANIVKQFSNKIKNLRYFYESSPGLHVGRHCGLKNSNADILVYADDDIRAFPTWLMAIKETFEQDPEVVLVGGKNLPDFEMAPPKWFEKLWDVSEEGRTLGYYSVLDFGDTVKEICPYYVWGCNFSIRKKILLALGGFHPDGMPKEQLQYRGDGETAVSAWIKANHGKTIYHPDASVYHLVSKQRMTPEYLYNRAFAQGISQSYTDVRKNKGILQVRKTTCNNYALGKKYLRRMFQWLQGLYDSEWESVQCALNKGFHEGYAFHQQKLMENEKLISWVLRENYYEP